MKKHRLFANILIVLLITGSLSTLIGYGLPIFLKPKILELIQQQTGRKATLDKFQFSLIPLTIQLQNITLPESNGKPFASIANFYAEINIWQSLSLSALVIEKLVIKNPVVHIVKQKNGKFNFEDLLKDQTNKQPDTPALPFNIVKLSLSDGILTWDDAPRKETVQSIELTVNNLSTFTDKKCQFDLQLSLTSGGNLSWKGELGLNPLISDGHITLKNIKLDQPFLLASLPFSLSGHALFDSDYKTSYGKHGFELTAAKAKIELHDFQYVEKGKNPIVVKTAHFTHENDFKFTYADNTWLLTSQKTRINLRNFDYADLTQPKTLIKIPSLTSESDFKFQSVKQHFHLSANKLRMNSQNLELQYANAKFKAPAISLETGIDNIFSDNTQVVLHQGKLNSQHLQLFDKIQDKPLIDISELAVNGVDFDLTKQSVNIDAIKADDTDARLVLTPKGTSYQTLFTDDKIDNTKIKPDTASVKSTSSLPWAIKINQIAFNQWGVLFEDKTQHKPVSIVFKPADFKLSGYSNKTGAKLPFQLNTKINTTGNMQLDGNFVVDPFAIQLAIDAKAIELEPFQPYFENFAHLDIIDGKFTTTGKLAVSTPDNQPLDLKFTGDSSISDLVTRDQKRHRDFIKWKTLSLKAFTADLRKDNYTADTLVIDKPYVKVTIKKDKTLNFSDVFISDGSQSPAKSADKPIEPHQQKTYFKLNKLQIIDGFSNFADRSLILPFATQIQSLDGGAHDISSDQKSTIKVSLKGNVYDLSPVDIDGYINPYSGNYDLNVNFKGMPMPLISSYMVEFAGYKIEKGKMTLKLKYKVVDDILSASNNIEIDQFELGEKVDNPKAVSLPLEMAIALLKDSDGKINIDVPITGSLNDPQFDIGAVISDALSNAISKVVTSPFHALAGLLGDNEASINNITFKAGDAVLDKTQQDKLTAVAKLLKERSELVLDIKGTAFETQDWSAIQDAALHESIKKIRAEEINKQNGNTKIQADYVELSDSDYKRLLAQEFIAKFPRLAKKSFFGTPELIDTKGDFYEVAKQYLSANLKSENHLKELAVQRAQAIANFLVQKNSVSNEQVFILSPAIDHEKNNKEINIILSLKAR